MHGNKLNLQNGIHEYLLLLTQYYMGEMSFTVSYGT